MFRKTLGVGVLALCSAVAITLAADAPKADLSSPKATVKSLFDCMLAGDFVGLKKLFTTPTTDEQKALLEEGISDDFYGPGLSKALRAKFPDARFPQADKMVEAMKAKVDGMDEKMDGDTCTLSMPATTRPSSGGPLSKIKLTKVGTEWKIVTEDGNILRKSPEQHREIAKARKALMVELITDINAGKYATYAEAEAAMRDKMSGLMKKHMGSTSGPASGPASRPTR